jgi:hypothetical protein
MSFFKVIMVSGLLWIGYVVPSERDEQPDYFKVLIPKAMAISAATGVMSALIDRFIFFPGGFLLK